MDFFFLVDWLTKCHQSTRAGRKSMPPSQERWHVHNNNDGSNMHYQFSSGLQKKPSDSASEAAAKVWPAGCQDIVLS